MMSSSSPSSHGAGLSPPGLASSAFHFTESLHALKHGGNSLSEANTHRGDAERRVAVDHIVDERGRDACAAGAERVPDRDGAAADVHLFFVQVECADAGQ